MASHDLKGAVLRPRSLVQELKGGTKMRIELPGERIRELEFLNSVVGEQYDVTRLLDCGGSEVGDLI